MTHDDDLHGVASTVCLIRDRLDALEVLLVKRPDDRGSFAGAWVFPGGAVDPEDGSGDMPEHLAARRAAVREVREETGLIVDESGLVTVSTWSPPRGITKRMRTWFYVAEAPAADVVIDPSEVDAYQWAAPGEVLAAHARGELTLYPPTWVTLDLLARFGSAAEALAQARSAEPATFLTRFSADRSAMLWQGDAAYEDGVLSDTPGPRHRLRIAALPWEYSKTPG